MLTLDSAKSLILLDQLRGLWRITNGPEYGDRRYCPRGRPWVIVVKDCGDDVVAEVGHVEAQSCPTDGRLPQTICGEGTTRKRPWPMGTFLRVCWIRQLWRMMLTPV